MNNRKNEKKSDNEGLFIPVRHVTLLVVGAFSVICIVFFGGYFIGKKHVMEQLVAKLEQDSFADQVYSSLCELYDYDDQQAVDTVADQTDCSQELSEEHVNEVLFSPLPVAETSSDAFQGPAIAQSEVVLPQYFAQLIGYQSKRYADMFAKKMEKKNIPVLVKIRKSITARGKTKEWYQVITKQYTDWQELQAVVDRVSREEKIKDARIITC